MRLMARCITYFTMLVEVLIIKNVKSAGVYIISWVTDHWQLTVHQHVNTCRMKLGVRRDRGAEYLAKLHSNNPTPLSICYAVSFCNKLCTLRTVPLAQIHEIINQHESAPLICSHYSEGKDTWITSNLGRQDRGTKQRYSTLNKGSVCQN